MQILSALTETNIRATNDGLSDHGQNDMNGDSIDETQFDNTIDLRYNGFHYYLDKYNDTKDDGLCAFRAVAARCNNLAFLCDSEASASDGLLQQKVEELCGPTADADAYVGKLLDQAATLKGDDQKKAEKNIDLLVKAIVKKSNPQVRERQSASGRWLGSKHERRSGYHREGFPSGDDRNAAASARSRAESTRSDTEDEDESYKL